MRTAGTSDGRTRDLSVPGQGAYAHAGGFDHAGPPGRSLDAPGRIAFRRMNNVGTLEKPFSRLNGRPTRTPVNASPHPRGTSTHDSGPVWSANLGLGGPSLLSPLFLFPGVFECQAQGLA